MPGKDLSGRLALITGATGGIGSATARALAARGCSIAVHYNSDAVTASGLADSLRSEQHQNVVRTEIFQADLGDYEQVKRLHADVVEKMGEISILFNNAGTTMGTHGVQTITDVDILDFERTWRTNCGSAYLLSQLCIPAMEKAGWGRVVFCSSVAGFTGGVVGPHYASSKSAMHGLIHWISQRYASTGITCNGVAPALIQGTKMLPGDETELAKKIPAGRLGNPEEVAETVVWMVNTGYVTNKVVGVDGGLFAQ